MRDSDARVVVVASGGDQVVVPGERLGRREAAAGVHLRRSRRTRAARGPTSSAPGVAQRCRRALEGGGDRRLGVVEEVVAHDGQARRTRSSAAACGSAPLRSAPASRSRRRCGRSRRRRRAWPTAARRRRAGTRAWVGFQPTRPQSAAGIRHEPPVSVPSAPCAIPSATETAPPEVEPPGMRRARAVPRVRRRAVVGVDARGRCRRTRSCSCGRRAPGPARRQRGDRGGVGARRAARRAPREPARVTCPRTSKRSLTDDRDARVAATARARPPAARPWPARPPAPRRRRRAGMRARPPRRGRRCAPGSPRPAPRTSSAARPGAAASSSSVRHQTGSK